MIRSKDALIEALTADPTASLYSTIPSIYGRPSKPRRYYVEGDKTEQTTVHGNAAHAAIGELQMLRTNSITTVYKLKRAEVLAVGEAIHAEAESEPAEFAPSQIAGMSNSVRMQRIGRILGKTPMPSDERVQNLVNNTETPTDYGAAMDAQASDAMFEEAAARLNVPSRMLKPNAQLQAYIAIDHAGVGCDETAWVLPLKYGQDGHVCPVTGRRAMTLQKAARYKLKEGERMHVHSKLPGKTWRRVAVIICANNACRLQWFGGGWRDIDRNRIVYVGE